MVLHGSTLILEPLYSSPSMITRHCLSCQDRSKVRRNGTVLSFLEGSRKVVYLGYKRFFVEGHRYRSKKFYNHFDGRPEFHLLQYNKTGTVFSKWFGPSMSFMGRRKMGGRKREIRHLSMAYHSRNSSSSTSTCRIGWILRSAMQLMVCTCRRMCLVI